jgi:metallo-beta-lactamase family protein
MELEFLGGAGTVTGSKTVVRAGTGQVLVDCGLFQGLKHLRRRNWEPLPLDPTQLDAIVLTHAHLDHSGAVPSIVRAGYRGPVYASRSTIALCRVLWPDSGRLQEEDAAYARRRGYSKHAAPRGLYTERDAEAALRYLEPVDFATPLSLTDTITAELAPAGHILGAAVVRITDDDASVLFSGDLGRSVDLVMPPPSTALSADTLVLESTYGDRRHDAADPLAALAAIVNRTVDRGGTVLVPAFAVGRTQAVLVAVARLKAANAIPDVPVFLDSPMASAATKAYVDHAVDHRLDADETAALAAAAHHIGTVEESKSLNHHRGPCIIISAAGMLTGGRVLHHFARLAPDPRNAIVIIGYQAVGTRGASLRAGQRSIKVHGALVRVRCRVEYLDMLSAHADQQELIDWVTALHPAPRTVVLNHGEPEAAEAMRRRITDELGIRCEVPTDRLRLPLTPSRAAPVPRPVPELGDGEGARLERIRASSSYIRADRDLELLGSNELRADRLMLEYLKVDLALHHAGVDALVPVFGSANIRDPESTDLLAGEAAWARYYAEARAFGRLVGTEAYDGSHRAIVVTGGGPGIMEAASRGAFDVDARAVGLNITLAHEQLPNSYLTPELTFQFRYFGVRKMHFLVRAVALVAFPGGFGTTDELYETLTLLRSGSMQLIPVVLVGSEFWREMLPLDFLTANGFIDERDRELCSVVDTGADAWRLIQDFYARRPHRAPPGPFAEP